MSIATKNALSAYAQAGLDAKVASASPHKLISMLFEGAIAAVNKAKLHLQKSQNGGEPFEIAEKGLAASRAIAIIEDGLMSSLDLELGGELAANLQSLYDYMVRTLAKANLENNEQGFTEVSRLLSELYLAWESIETQDPAKNLVADEKTISRSGAVTYGRV